MPQNGTKTTPTARKSAQAVHCGLGYGQGMGPSDNRGRWFKSGPCMCPSGGWGNPWRGLPGAHDPRLQGLGRTRKGRTDGRTNGRPSVCPDTQTTRINWSWGGRTDRQKWCDCLSGGQILCVFVCPYFFDFIDYFMLIY